MDWLVDAFSSVISMITDTLSSIMSLITSALQEVSRFVERVVDESKSLLASIAAWSSVILILSIILLFVPVIGGLVAYGLNAALAAAYSAFGATFVELTATSLAMALAVSAIGFTVIGLMIDKDQFIRTVNQTIKIVADSIGEVVAGSVGLGLAIGSATGSALGLPSVGTMLVVGVGAFALYKYATRPKQERTIVVNDQGLQDA